MKLLCHPERNRSRVLARPMQSKDPYDNHSTHRSRCVVQLGLKAPTLDSNSSQRWERRPAHFTIIGWMSPQSALRNFPVIVVCDVRSAPSSFVTDDIFMT